MFFLCKISFFEKAKDGLLSAERTFGTCNEQVLFVMKAAAKPCLSTCPFVAAFPFSPETSVAVVWYNRHSKANNSMSFAWMARERGPLVRRHGSRMEHPKGRVYCASLKEKDCGALSLVGPWAIPCFSKMLITLVGQSIPCTARTGPYKGRNWSSIELEVAILTRDFP